MADGFDVELEGINELTLKLKGLSNDLQYKGGRFALLKASNIVRAAAIKNVERFDDITTSEEIGKNIVTRWGSRRFRATGDLMFRVGVLGGARQRDTQKKQRRRERSGATSLVDLGEVTGKGKGNPGGDTFYWRFLEFGTESISAKHPMRDALSQNAQAATNEFIKQYDKSIDRYLSRIAKGK